MVRRARAGDRPTAARGRPQGGDRGPDEAGDPLARCYELARDRAETAARLATRGGDYPLLGRGDVNIYSLFVERAQQLISGSGLAELLVPSGILSDKNSSSFLEELFTGKRYSFRNRLLQPESRWIALLPGCLLQI